MASSLLGEQGQAGSEGPHKPSVLPAPTHPRNHTQPITRQCPASAMPQQQQFAANLAMMFADSPFLERFQRAANAGFAAVEISTPEMFATPSAEVGILALAFALFYYVPHLSTLFDCLLSYATVLLTQSR